MTHTDYDLLRGEYQAILEILQELNAYLIILDKPQIALPGHARNIVCELDDALSACSLPKYDRKAVRDYIDNARTFCCSYFKQDATENLPAICPLRLPCDSRELLEAHSQLDQQYIDLRTNLRVSLRNLKAELHVT